MAVTAIVADGPLPLGDIVAFGIGLAILTSDTPTPIKMEFTREELDRIDDRSRQLQSRGIHKAHAEEQAKAEVRNAARQIERVLNSTGLAAGDRRAQISERLSNVAELRGWERANRSISRLNPSRTIFEEKDRRGKIKSFWSIDFEKGRFEKFDPRGKHQGEFDADGNQTGKPDPKGKHDIKVN